MAIYKTITVFGIEFQSISHLCSVLKYKNRKSENVIKKNFGSFEDFVKMRLHVTNNNDAKFLLKRACDEYVRNLVSSDEDHILAQLKSIAINNFILNKESKLIIKNLLDVFNDKRTVDDVIKQLTESKK